MRTAGSFRTGAKGSIKARVSEARIKTGAKASSRIAGKFRTGPRDKAKVEFRAKVEFKAKVKDRTRETRVAPREKEGTGSAVRPLRGGDKSRN